jgi:hypothetical protein
MGPRSRRGVPTRGPGRRDAGSGPLTERWSGCWSGNLPSRSAPLPETSREGHSHPRASSARIVSRAARHRCRKRPSRGTRTPMRVVGTLGAGPAATGWHGGPDVSSVTCLDPGRHPPTCGIGTGERRLLLKPATRPVDDGRWTTARGSGGLGVARGSLDGQKVEQSSFFPRPGFVPDSRQVRVWQVRAAQVPPVAVEARSRVAVRSSVRGSL